MSHRLLAALALWAAAAGPLPAQDKKRVAVLDFEYQTVRSYVNEVFGTEVDIGRGITTMLVTELVRNGTYSVIERQAMDQILREQNFQVSGRADPSSAAQLGKLLGVDAVIIGAVTQFGRDDKNVGVGGVGVGPVRLGRVGRSSSKAQVGIDARLIDVTTAEILAVAEGKGESKRSGTDLFGAAGGMAGGVDMSSSNFASTIIGEATKSAVENLTKEVVGANTRIVARVVPISALVADVAGTEVTIGAGVAAGVKNGGTYDVIRPGREIKDASGRVIRRVTTPVGSVKITEVGPDYSVGQMTGGPAQAGDCVGSCPAAAAAPAPQQPSAAPAPAPAQAAVPAAAPVALGAIAALPSGPWAWAPYQFKGTEHFKYDVRQVNGRDVSTGYYVLDIQPAGGGRYRMKVDGKLGDEAYSSTVTAPDPNAGMGGMAMGQLMALGPVGLALFNPAFSMMFMGRELSLGDGWSQSSGGNSFSAKVESQCNHAGVNGLMTVMRENQEVKSQSCVSPNVALPLAVTLNNDSDDKIEMKLVEFRP